MADETNSGAAIPTLEDWQHWTLVMGRAQQMMMEAWADSLKKDQPCPAWSPGAFGFADQPGATDPMALMTAGAQAWAKGGVPEGLETVGPAAKAEKRDVFLYVISGDKVRNPAAAMELIARAKG